MTLSELTNITELFDKPRGPNTAVFLILEGGVANVNEVNSRSVFGMEGLAEVQRYTGLMVLHQAAEFFYNIYKLVLHSLPHGGC